MLLVLAGSYAAASGNLTDLMLIADGVVLLPGWLIWSGHTGGAGCIGRAARTSVPT